MGHIRIGRIPKTKSWKQLISLLNSPDSSSAEIATSTAGAAKDFFIKNKTDPALIFSYWILTQITYKARNKDFVSELISIGLDITDVYNSLEFLSKITNFTSKESNKRHASFPLSEIAQLAFREIVSDTIGQQCQSIFGTTQEDIRIACSRYSSPNQFAKLSRLYFSKVFYRTLQYFISKESYNNIGIHRKFEDISKLSDFNNSLEAYCYQSAKIVEQFAGGWYSKRNWQGEITEKDAKGFVAVAIEKLIDEVAHEEQVEEHEK